METLALLAQGFAVALTPDNLIWSIIGVTLGTAIGVLPGIGPATTVAILMPLTVGLPPVSAFIMFAGIYYGAQYGGSTTSILLNTPGEAGSMMTASTATPWRAEAVALRRWRRPRSVRLSPARSGRSD